MLKIQLKFPTVPCCFKSNIAEMQKFLFKFKCTLTILQSFINFNLKLYFEINTRLKEFIMINSTFSGIFN